MIDSNHNNTEIPADPHEEQESQSSVKVIAARSKAKAKPQKRDPVDVPSIIPMNERKWIDIEPSEPTLAAMKESGLLLNQRNPLSLCVRGLEESNQSSSTYSNSTAGRRWSNSILENQEFSSKSIPTDTLLVGRSLESLLGSRRRFNNEISVLL